MELPIAMNFLPPTVSSFIPMLLDKLKEFSEDILCYWWIFVPTWSLILNYKEERISLDFVWTLQPGECFRGSEFKRAMPMWSKEIIISGHNSWLVLSNFKSPKATLCRGTGKWYITVIHLLGAKQHNTYVCCCVGVFFC